MFKLSLIKSGFQLITGLGVGYIADNALSMVKPKHFTGIKKFAVSVGSYVLSAIIVDKTTTYIEEVWDEKVNEIKDFIGPKEKEEVIIEE